MNKSIATIILIFLLGPAFSQTPAPTYKDYFMEGSFLILENNFQKARENFIKAYDLDSSNANIQYILGFCYLQTDLHKAKAERYLEKAIKDVTKNYKNDDYKEKHAAPIAYFYYGQALHINYKFDLAIENFNMFRTFVSPKDKEYLDMIDKEIATAEIAKLMVAKPINVQITNFGDSINTEFPEYSPVLSADERQLIFTTRRPTSTGEMKDEDGRFFEDIVISYKDDKGKWSKPVTLSPNVNSYGHEASINLTPDGQTLIVYKNDPGTKNPEGDGNIYFTTYDGKEWSTLQAFGSNVNTPYWETHACLSSDESVLFFVSDRPGGLGGKDIYRCVKLPNGKWSKALNMGPTINTSEDEDGAFIHPDGKTFFFSSKGHKSMGGYDIMSATLNEENKFDNIQNMGYPINTTDDDVFFVVSPDGKRGYFSSAHEGGYGDEDIYRITIGDPKESFLALFKGQLIAAEGETLPDNISIVVTDKYSNEIVGTYRPRSQNGTFSAILPPGKEYNFSYQTENGEEFYNEDIYVTNEQAYQEIKREITLEPVKIGGGKPKVKQKSIILNTIVLNTNKAKKSIPGAKITLEDETGAKQYFDANKKGKYDGIPLMNEKKYSIFAEANGKKSGVTKISTIGLKTAKIFNQVIYLDGKIEKFTSKELLLDVVVKSNQSKQPVPNTSIILTDADGERYQVTTNEKGVAKNIELGPETRYELMANKDGAISEKAVFTTGAIAEGKKISKTLYINYDESAITTKSGLSVGSEDCGPEGTYSIYYKYGKRDVEIDEACWERFINYIAEISAKQKITVSVKGSASLVPRRAKGGNKALAEMRANNMETALKTRLKEKGVKLWKVKITKSSVVGGPEYKGDWKIGRKKYEKHQYAKAKVSVTVAAPKSGP